SRRTGRDFAARHAEQPRRCECLARSASGRVSLQIVICCLKEQFMTSSVKPNALVFSVPARPSLQQRPVRNGGSVGRSGRAEQVAKQILALARREGLKPGDRLI